MKTTTKADLAMLALLDVLAEIADGSLTVSVGCADDLHRAIRRLAEIEN